LFKQVRSSAFWQYKIYISEFEKSGRNSVSKFKNVPNYESVTKSKVVSNISDEKMCCPVMSLTSQWPDLELPWPQGLSI